MSELDEELRSLAADLRAWLDDQLGRGVRVEFTDVEADEQGPATSEPEEQAAVPAPAPAWSSIAAAARAVAEDGHGADGLARVRADLGDCRRCKLCEGRKNLVFGVGDADADLMVIGEGPGEQEDLRGEPFVGPAGQMLDNMLERVLGLKRSQVYIANVVKCRPPDNRKPELDEAAACKPFLARQIEAIQPKVILVLGSVALEHVLGQRGITRLRGKEHLYLGRILAIPTFHPAYLLRKPEDKRFTFEDLKLLRQRYDERGGRRG